MQELKATKEPVRAMLQTLALQTKLGYNERRIVSSLYDRYETVGRLSPSQVSLVTSIYLKYHDPKEIAAKAQEAKEGAKAPKISIKADVPRKESRWSKLLK